MRKGVAAFTLLEMVIALALTSLLSLLVAQWFSSSHLVVRHQAQQTTRLMALYSAQNVLARDMQQAPANLQEWYELGDGTYVWRTANLAVGWHVENDTLYRTQGHYDVKKQHWGKHKKNCVAVGVHQCVLKPVYKHNGTIEAIEGSLMATIDGKERTFLLYERVRNGQVV